MEAIPIPMLGRVRLSFWLGGVMVLLIGIASAMIWQNLAGVNELNRQKIITALTDSVDGMEDQVMIVEIMANSLQGIVSSGEGEDQACAQFCLRAALTAAIGAFEQHPYLSQLGLIMTTNGAFGNLERLDNGNIVMWLSPFEGGDAGESFLWTGKNFIPYFPIESKRDESARENLRSLRVQQTASQTQEAGTWQLRDSSWMIKTDVAVSPWRVGYSKALHDERGRLISVLDADFSVTQLAPAIEMLQQRHNITLRLIDNSEPPQMVTAEGATPLQVPPEFVTLLEAVQALTTAQAEEQEEQQGERAVFHTNVLSLQGARSWAAIQPLSLQGDSNWHVLITRPAPWGDVLAAEQIVYVLTLALVLVAGFGIVLVYLMGRFGRAHSLKLSADLHHSATHDDLTGLPNRGAFDAQLKKAIAKTQDNPCKIALLYLALDRFKSINDNYGYLFGNAVLRSVGETLTHLVRDQDMVAYLSGDRFLILLEGLPNKDDAHRLTRQIMEGLKQPLIIQGREIHLAASIGVSLYPSHGETVNTLINHADIAMYEAKKIGGDSFQFFTAELGQKIQAKLDMEERLKEALAENQLHLAYQPKVSLHDGKIVGCEVLLRWTHPEFGEIPPSHFIPIAEAAGLIVPIGDWILQAACQQAKTWCDNGLEPASIAVNLSMRQFLRRDVVKWVANVLQQTGLPAHCLELELTESLLPHDMERMVGILERLSSLGIKLALDDFGTGYSNLSYLKRLHLDTLKIDQAFVRGALSSSQDRAIISTIVELAHNLGYKALAEGVETQAQLDFVRSQQCDEVQGYYFSPPVAPETYAIMLRDGIKLKSL